MSRDEQEPVLALAVFRAVFLVSAAALLVVPALLLHPPRSSVADGHISSAMAYASPRKIAPVPGIHFAWAGDFAEGLAPVREGGKYGFIDTSGGMRIGPAYACAGGFSGNRAPAMMDGKWGYLDVTGRAVIPARFDYAGAFREGLAPVAVQDSFGFIDSNGTPVGGMDYTDARPYSEGLAAVRVGFDDYSAWGFVDKRGEMAIPPLFTDVPGGFSGGLAVVKMEGELPYRSGFIDTSGGFAIDTLYDAAGDFHEGRAPVGRGEWMGGRFRGVWGYIDTSGRLATPLAYSSAGAFREGRALVRLSGGGNAWIDPQGAVLSAFPEDLEIARPETGDLVTYKVRERCGFLDPSGRRITPPVFSEAGDFRQGRARVRLVTGQADIWGYIDGNGRYLGGTVGAGSR